MAPRDVGVGIARSASIDGMRAEPTSSPEATSRLIGMPGALSGASRQSPGKRASSKEACHGWRGSDAPEVEQLPLGQDNPQCSVPYSVGTLVVQHARDACALYGGPDRSFGRRDGETRPYRNVDCALGVTPHLERPGGCGNPEVESDGRPLGQALRSARSAVRGNQLGAGAYDGPIDPTRVATMLLSGSVPIRAAMSICSSSR